MICYLCTLSARITTRRLRCPACVGGARVVLASRPYGRPGQEGAVPGGYFGANPNCEPASAALQGRCSNSKLRLTCTPPTPKPSPSLPRRPAPRCCAGRWAIQVRAAAGNWATSTSAGTLPSTGITRWWSSSRRWAGLARWHSVTLRRVRKPRPVGVNRPAKGT